MNDRKQLAKVAYLYYIDGKSQTEISHELGIGRTSISRMLHRARVEGVVSIEIAGFDTEIYFLESKLKSLYGLQGVEIVQPGIDEEIDDAVSQAAAKLIRSKLVNHSRVGISWGRTLSKVVEVMAPRQMKSIQFYPLAGGPSYINARYHVNTLIYEMAKKCHGDCSFINATIVQENTETAQGIMEAKYFEDIRQSWEALDMAIIGIGGRVDEHNKQWLDMLTTEDFQTLEAYSTVGEVCCRFLDKNGQEIDTDLKERTIAISVAELSKIPETIAIAYGDEKVEAIDAVLKSRIVNYFVTDSRTASQLLSLQ